MRFQRLRMDAHAQYEIRVFADVIAALVADWVPLTWEAFSDFRVGGRFLSRHEVAVLRDALAGKPISQETSGLSVREWRGLTAAFGLKLDN